MNNKIVLTLALACAGLGVLPAAALADGFFLDGRIGNSSIDGDGFDDSDVAIGINGGYRWGIFGLEGGYTDLGSFHQNFSVFDDINDTTPENLNSRVDLGGYTLGGNIHYNVNENWYLSGRAGLFRWKGDTDVTIGNATQQSSNLRGTDWYAGVGVGYDFNARIGIGLNYDHYAAKTHGADLDTDVTSVSTEVRF